MRIVTYAIVVVIASSICLGVGYYMWGSRVADLTRELREQRSDYEYRLAEQERRIKAAEEQAQQEAKTRKVLEEELNRVRPQK
jgi:predicted Holliday junction resolvase-like endonuclease